VLLHNADAIITPLATLSRVAQPPPASGAPAEENGVAPQAPNGNAIQAPPPPAAVPPPSPQTTTARPSASCANARSRGEIAVCGDSALTALDRDMSTEYGRAIGVATPAQRDQLRETARRFYAYRDRCPDRQCMAAAYAGRVREIRDIIQGRWQPPR
jgi:hypothetical protein